MIGKRKVVALAALLALAGFTPLSNAQETYIALVSKGFQHQFWQAVRKGAEQAAADNHVKISYEAPETELQVDKQMDMLAAALAKHPSAVGFAATDSKAAIPLMKKAKAENIPVIAFDSGVDSDVPVTTATTDNKGAAALTADKLAALIGDSGDVLVLAHDQVSTTGVARRDGFISQMKEKHPNVKVIDVQYPGDPLKAAELARAMVQSHPSAKGMFATNEGAAIGAGRAMKEIKKTGLVLVGFDSGKGQKDLINEGVIAGSITQNPVGIGYKTVEAAVKTLKGEKLPKVIDTGFYWYDKTNMTDPKIASVLYD